MSLRTRLIATLLVLSAAGLVVLGAITYFSQRSFENERVDEQTRAALPAVARALDDEGVPGGLPSRSGGAPGAGPGPSGLGPADANLPLATYAERRTADGDVLGSVALSYGQDDLAPPDLPAELAPGDLITVGAQGDDDLQYRVRASPGFGLGAGAIPLSGVDAALDRLLVVEALVIGAVLLALALLSWLLVRAGLRPLERIIGETADAIAAGDLSRRVEVTGHRTEVGRLGPSLNAKLGRLDEAFRERERSESRLRRFLADVSHELRTPLASIRGYAELFRIGAARRPEDAGRAMTRIEEEAARMGVSSRICSPWPGWTRYASARSSSWT